MIRKSLAGFAGFIVVLLICAAFAMALTPPPTLAPLASVAAAEDRIRTSLDDFPAASHFRARDGKQLTYRLYRGAAHGGVAIFIHGATGDARAVHVAARTLAKQGITVIAPDLRGHGADGPRGDIAYEGQLDDDLSDLIEHIARDYPEEHRLLIGHSAGGAYILRFAGGARGDLFDAYLALSPALSNAPTQRPAAGGWVSVSVLRIIGLTMLDRMGVHSFDGLKTIAYATRPEDRDLTSTYSFRLMSNFGLPRATWRESIRAIHRRTQVLIGAQDEMFIADRYASVLTPLQPRLSVAIAPNANHMGILLNPGALELVAENAKMLLSAP